ncbi:MAG: hypothetical protein JO199_10600, partial [Candidatus Eremiobacteraeota bacterium]|nr:hypothetical protein [Candidatus Eremiobacteraeota bacterium]
MAIKPYGKLTSALLAIAMAAACSAGPAGTNSFAPAQPHAFAWHGKMGRLHVRIAVPSRKQQRRIAKLNPRYIPPDTTCVVFSLVAVNGYATGSPATPTAYDFGINATASSNTCQSYDGVPAPSSATCTQVSGGNWNCDATVAAPVAT